MTIEQIKIQLTLSQVLTHYNLTTDKNSRLCCLWHNDKTPSLQIYPKTNTWTCFSSNCSAGSGDQIDFIMKMEKCTKHKAILKAKALLGETIIQTTSKKMTTDYKELFAQLRRNNSSGQALQYLEKRNLDRKKIQVGYNAKKWEYLRYCIIFPLRNRDGDIVSFYGRGIYDRENAKHFYLKNRSGLYPNYPKPETKTLILTEAIIDAATLLQLDLEMEVLAMYGTNGLTEEHQAAIKRLTKLEEIVLFFDGDEAGRKAIEKWTPVLRELQPKTKISYVHTPEGEDVNSLSQSHESDIFTHLLKERLFFSIENKKGLQSEDHVTSTQPNKGDIIDALITENPELLIYQKSGLHISILGGIKITGLDKLRVTLKIEHAQNRSRLPIRQSLDLYHTRQVDQLIERISEDMKIDTQACRQIINDLTSELENHRIQRLELLQNKKKEASYQMTDEERKAALTYLKAPNLMGRTTKDIAESGVVGEANNALIGHLIYTSRKRHKPLHVMYLGSSGSGKTYLQEKLSELIPEEDKKSVTALSDQSLYYQGKQLQHKILFIEDIDGAENVMYMIRELQSKGRISKTVVWKDPQGNMQSIDVVAEGPLSISSCTTRERVYEDNANRCILLHIDDSRAQDKLIMDYICKLSAGLIDKYAQDQIKQLHKNVQRLLQPIQIINPYAQYIELPPEVFKPRRSLSLLLGFIETISFYHQYQRSVQVSNGKRYIQSTVEDIEVAFVLMKEVLFSKSDELTKASRRFLERLKAEVKDGSVFSTQEIRKKLRISTSSIHRYISELTRTGYISYKGGNRQKGYEYEINDYEEYQKLKGSIDKKLSDIITNIKKCEIGVPVSQTYPSSKNGIMNPQSINALS